MKMNDDKYIRLEIAELIVNMRDMAQAIILMEQGEQIPYELMWRIKKITKMISK